MKTMDLYFVEVALPDEPIIYLEVDSVEIGTFLADGLFLDPNEAIERFKANILAKIAHLRTQADFLMDNLKSIQPMEDL